MKTAIVAITDGGADLARRIGHEVGLHLVWLPERQRAEDDCNYFAEPVGALLPRLFAEVDGLVCIMATGIVVRTLAPHLRGKERDPAVVVLDELGRFAISLLSGHLGGANDLARELARLTGGQAVITTATDVNGLPAWDEAARLAGLGIDPLAHVRTLNSLLLRGEPIVLVDRRRRIADVFAGLPGIELAATFAAALKLPAAGRVFVTHRHIPHLERQPELLVLRPRDLVVGIGCNRGTSADEIEAVVLGELKHAYLAFASVAGLATISEKADEAGLNEFARRHGLTLEYHSAAALNAVAAPAPPSPHALAAVGAKGVCEPAALLSAGTTTLLVRKRKSGNVTVAVAEIGEGHRTFGGGANPEDPRP
jgi:cobalt-precorrin 5A hydrolase